MSDSVRGIAIVLSVLLWSPVAPGLLHGEVSAEKAMLLYGAALALALTGCSLLAGLLRAYAPEPEPEEQAAAEPAPEPAAPVSESDGPGRRAEDALT